MGSLVLGLSILAEHSVIVSSLSIDVRHRPGMFASRWRLQRLFGLGPPCRVEAGAGSRSLNVDPVVDVPDIRNQLHDFLQELLQVVRGHTSRKDERVSVRLIWIR